MIQTNDFFPFGQMWSVSSLLDFTPLTEAQKKHLTLVYATLAASALVTAAGAALPIQYLNIHTTILLVVCLGTMLYVRHAPHDTGSYEKTSSVDRMIALGIMAFAQGLLLRETVYFMMLVKPEIVTTALFATIATFTCFTLGSLVISARMVLYIGGMAFSLFFYLFLVSLANIFIGSSFVSSAVDVGVLVACCGFVIFNTQLAIKEFNNGSHDYLSHAVLLYSDLIQMFVQYMMIMYKKEERKDKKKNKPRPLFENY
ncbi:Inhibitor of apoptosis-promoting Bax1 family protein [Babesia bovis T2Bo]|uniref:Bax inhibitor-1, putative n=1 Tax=Babesia bovis TaxID=5865 RepID=A7AX64_BABBO|nr:Inhibitor of apoptosis-promoting Bax1 family protein [Babesia bovis T2Bo]EDO05137.1 Inhibitor of apoptosis-promoting Bax1 family protein [Babesia bovis T2Bo]BAN66039.1 Bax inhibitor-1, putative [Babesia bovis]|eukprot:XP_001608705.1 Bax inhibitor-1 [Babesia bovis T2Bo]